MFRFLALIIGFSLTVSGGLSVIAYLNLLATGHSLLEYTLFLLKRVEFYLLPIGLLMIYASLYVNRSRHR
ncbi:hypothetical protein ELQ35_06670 [Peribacillus cavernae]|uniref:Uncharacterized protein n=1 Tax=Peribacillus cavernae TaxID=1674310 RepID=A0A433HQN8_9BACI|nr:hypothetical protein ELQ35_06670 [Peribacillus cavernae]